MAAPDDRTPSSPDRDPDPSSPDAGGTPDPPPDATPAAAPPDGMVSPADAEARKATGRAPAEAVTAVLEGARASSAPLPRRPWFSDLPDRGLFLLFLLLGTSLVLALKLLLPEARLGTWLATGTACATLVGYAALAWRVRMPGDRLGDNCYYLGFLLTLASMAAALIHFDITAGDRGPVIERLIGSFGIALLSTFLGIALRAAFLQMRLELDDLEDRTRRDLQERAELLRGQLLHAVTELESFRLRTRQVLEERLMEVTDLFAEHVRAQAEEALRLARGLAEQGGRALAAHTEQTMRLEAAIRAQTEAAATLAERLGRIEVPPDLFREEVRAVTERLRGPVATLERAAARLAERIEAIDVPADLVASRLEPLAAALTRATEAVERLARTEAPRLEALDGRVAEATRAIEAATHLIAQRSSARRGWLSSVLGRRRTRG